MMGSPEDEPHRYRSEGPQHKVTFARPFAISKYSVTFDDWDACATYGDCDPRIKDSGWGRGRQPMIYITWDDAKFAENPNRPLQRDWLLEVTSHREMETFDRAIDLRTRMRRKIELDPTHPDCDSHGTRRWLHVCATRDLEWVQKTARPIVENLMKQLGEQADQISAEGGLRIEHGYEGFRSPPTLKRRNRLLVQAGDYAAFIFQPLPLRHLKVRLDEGTHRG